MNVNYQREYQTTIIDNKQLMKDILELYKGYDVKTMYNYDQLLFILDEKCKQGRADRSISQQLFNQSHNISYKSSIYQLIFKYIENIQTSKICLLRQQNCLKILYEKHQNIQPRKNTYIYLKIIQASVYARYSDSPSFEYKIQPSNIPTVTMVNSLNPILNHQYTLLLETTSFRIRFSESGKQIYTWQWPDCQGSFKEGEYNRSYVTQALSFEIKLKYLPQGYPKQKQQIYEQIKQKKQLFNVEFKAFKKLCQFQPFLNIQQKQQLQSNQINYWFQLTTHIIQILPFMAKHVRNLHLILILFILIQCLATLQWPMECIDIILGFAALGILYEKSQFDVGMPLWIITLSLVLSILKSIWGSVLKPFAVIDSNIFIILAIVIKIVCILFICFTNIRKKQVPLQRKEDIYRELEEQIKKKQNLFQGKKNEKKLRIGFQTYE